MYIVVDHYHIDREVVATAWNLCDRMISKQTTAGLNQNRLGVILVTCLLLSIKLKLSKFPEGEIADNLVKSLCTLIGRDQTCTPAQINDMEKEMLKTLDWKVNAPTMQDFVRLYVDLHPVGKFGERRDEIVAQYLHDVMKYQVEQAIYKQALMMNYKPSVIAFAAMMRVEEQLDNNVLPTNVRETETLLLHGELKFEPAETEECLFALENYTEKITPYEEYEAGYLANNSAMSAANNGSTVASTESANDADRHDSDNKPTDSTQEDNRTADRSTSASSMKYPYESKASSSNKHDSNSRGRSRSRSFDDQEGSGDEDERRGRSRKEKRKKKRERSKSSRRRSASYSSTSSSSSSYRSRSRSRKRKKHTDKRSKKSKKRRQRSKKCDASSTSSSSSSYDRDRKRRKKQKKKQKVDDDKSNIRDKSDVISKQSEQTKESPQANPSKKKAFPVTSIASKPPPSVSARSRAPMTQQQYLDLQKQIKEVVDPQTGRTRLIRGTGEIIERIVSRDEHSRLNKSATLGDGSGYAQDIMQAALKRERERK